MAASRSIYAALMTSILLGCGHPIEIRGKGEGDVRSLSGTRDCLLEEYQGGLANCSENLVEEAYEETYTAQARTGSQFHRWGAPYCPNSDASCSFNIPASVVELVWHETMPPLQAIFRRTQNSGFKSIVMGGNQLHPVAEALAGHAAAAGFTDHEAFNFTFEGTTQGAPAEFWADPIVRSSIQQVLDEGDVDLVGMDYRAEFNEPGGYTNWVKYALGKNPDTRFFIAPPWGNYAEYVDFLPDWLARHQQVHALLEHLRESNPGVDFYCIPQGNAGVQSVVQWHLADVPSNPFWTPLYGSEPGSVFSDSNESPGDDLLDLSALLWLRSIYGVDLYDYRLTFPYPYPYPYEVIDKAHEIHSYHRLSGYNAPPEIHPDADGDGIANRHEEDDDNDGVIDTLDECPLWGPNETENGCPVIATSLTRVTPDSPSYLGSRVYSDPVLSATGRYVVFVSNAAELVPEGGVSGQIFLKDLVAGTIEPISVNLMGKFANGPSSYPSVSDDGRYIAFTSDADNLVPGDTNGDPDLFLRDRLKGTTTRFNVDLAGNQIDTGVLSQVEQTILSGDGRFAMFISGYGGLVPNDTNIARDVFVRNLVTNTTTRVDLDSEGNQTGGTDGLGSFSADGRYVAFSSTAQLDEEDEQGTGLWRDIYVRDMVEGITRRINVDSQGNRAEHGHSYAPSLSADGRYVVYQSTATNLVPGDTNGAADIFLHDTITGSTKRVSVASSGLQANGRSLRPDISADGRFISFDSISTNLVQGDTNGIIDVFIHDTFSGTTTRVSVDSSGNQSPDEGPSANSLYASLSANGNFVVFQAGADLLVPDDSNGHNDLLISPVP